MQELGRSGKREGEGMFQGASSPFLAMEYGIAATRSYVRLYLSTRGLPVYISCVVLTYNVMCLTSYFMRLATRVRSLVGGTSSKHTQASNILAPSLSKDHHARTLGSQAGNGGRTHLLLSQSTICITKEENGSDI